MIPLATALRERGHHCSLWISTHPRMDDIAAKFAAIGTVIRAPYVNTYDLPLRSLQAPFRYLTINRVARQLRDIAPHVVHLNKQNLEDGLDLVRAVARSGLPSVGMVHMTQTAEALKAKFAFVRDAITRRALLENSGIWVALADNRYRELHAFLGDRVPIRSVPNGVSLPKLSSLQEQGRVVREALGVSSAQVLVAAVGPATPPKDPDCFLDIVQRLKERHPQVRFVWIGSDDWNDEWERQVNERNLETALKRVSRENNVAPYYGAADVFLAAGDDEALPVPVPVSIFQALAAGLPVLLSKQVAQAFPSLGEGTCLPLEDQDAVDRILTDPGARLEAAQRARASAEERFSIDKAAILWESFYLEARNGVKPEVIDW